MEAICPMCDAEYDEICGNCITSQQTCVLCFTQFEIADNVIRCKECFYMGHQENFAEWLKTQGKCPACRIEFEDKYFEEIELKEGTIRELYLEKSSVYFKRKEVFKEFSFQLPYYNFQQYVLDDLIDQLQFDTSHLLISPPGSGKTIIGLSTVSHFAVNTLVLTPNLAVLGSWIDRLEMFYDAKNSNMPLQEIYTRSSGDLRPITITTYQHINSSLRELSKVNRNKSEKYKLLQDPINFIERLLNHEIGFIILDEAHRLTGTWGENIMQLLDLIGETKILGLTATPPQNVDEQFDNIFHERKTEIPLPMLVRENVLAPFRDFSIIFPSRSELEKMHLTFDELDMSTQDTYTRMKAEFVKNTLEEIDYLRKNYIPQGDNPYNQRWLSANLSYVTQLTIDIILHELSMMDYEFRGLVLLEQENLPAKYDIEIHGTGGAIGMFESLLKIEEVDTIDPVFVTGKSLLIDDDFVTLFEEEGAKWIQTNNIEMSFTIKETKKGYAIVNGHGRDWNTDTYTRYVTYLFEKGITKLLIGTRFLLGEGWDSRSLNTVIDLTTFSSYAFVNQVKGRALRKDPDEPKKVSNMWEIAPHPYLSPYSENEYNNYVKRHKIYFGIDQDGDIRNGVDRLNPYLRSQYEETVKFVDDIMSKGFENQMGLLKEMSMNRAKTYELWKVGQKLGELYYSIRFNIDIPVELLEIQSKQYQRQIFDHIHELIEMTLKQIAIQYDFVNFSYIIELEPNITNYRVKLLIPVEESYENITRLYEFLQQNKPTETIGLVIKNNFYDRNILIATLLHMFGKPISVKLNQFMIYSPLPLKMINEGDLLSYHEISYDAYIIKEVQGTEKNLQVNAELNLISLRNIHHAELDEIAFVQKYFKAKDASLIGPYVGQEFELQFYDFMLDQEYVDLE